MQSLAEERPVFHSEADFQHALAWKIHTLIPNARVRLEYPVPMPNKKMHVDILAWINDEPLAIELKYGTDPMNDIVHGEQFNLRAQAADDLMRHGYCKDVERLEFIKSKRIVTRGIAILLTNYPNFWLPPKSKSPTTFEAFRIHEGRVLHGELNWHPRTAQRTQQFSGGGVRINGHYPVHWRDYSRIGTSHFRYAAVTV
jgi:hypothetical protein